LEKLAGELGADLFGVADLTTVGDFIRDQGGEYLRKFPRAVSIGVRLLDAIVDELHRHEEPSPIFTYEALYNYVNSRLEHIALLVAKRIQEEGYSAYPIPPSQIIDHERLIGVVSHKLAAHLAGLGWIGKSCLLVSPGYGPRVRFATVLTDAPLETGSPMESECGDCRSCVDICPVNAFTGASFDPFEPREVRYNAQMCNKYLEDRGRSLGSEFCGLCVYVCPHGRGK
jgi:epoxyqueuosine reductase QueG